MRDNKIKCPRCGKEMTLTLKNVAETMECSHCHKKMVLTKKSDTMRMVCGYIVSMMIVTAMMVVMQPLAKTNNAVYLISVTLSGIILGLLMSKYTVNLAFILFGVSYRDIDLAVAEEKEKQAKKAAKKK